VILIVTHSKDLSADLVIRHLNAAKRPFLRLNTDRLGTPECHFGFYDEPTLTMDGQTITQSAFGAVWARRFARPTILMQVEEQYRDFTARENAVLMDAFLETMPCYQMNPHMADRMAGNRLAQAQRAKAVGFTVPDTCATQDAREVAAFLERYPRSVVKALSFGRLAEDSDGHAGSVAYTSIVGPDTDWSGLATGPVLLQERIDCSYEWRVTTVGTAIFAARLPATAQVDWRRLGNDAVFEAAILPQDAADRLLLLCRESGIAFGAHDLMETADGEFVFLETNPAGQWGWLEVSLGLPIGSTIAKELMANDA